MSVFASSLKGFFRYEVSHSNAHLTLHGVTTSEQFGATLATGDLNADGFPDLITGAPTFSSFSKDFRGKVSVFYGGPKFFSGNPEITFLGPNANQQFGTSLVTGDFNGDGIDDLVIGTVYGGKVYFVWGRKNPYIERTIDLSRRQPDMILQNFYESEKFGFALDALDINGDGHLDLAIGAPDSHLDKKKRAGFVYIVYGGDDFGKDMIRHFYYKPANIILKGKNAGDQFGSTLTHGDFDDDGVSDLAVGAYLATYGDQGQRGTVSIFYGDSNRDPVKYALDNFHGEKAFSWFGYSLAGKDVDGNGVDDLTVSSFPFQNFEVPGKVDVFLGGNRGSMSEKRMTFSYPDVSYVFGTSLAVSDVNRDGKPDLFFGAAGIRSSQDVFPGRVIGLTDINRVPGRYSIPKSPEDFRISGNVPYDWFGSSMIFDDFNKDGVQDLVVGAPSDFSDANGRVGSVYVFPGPLLPRGDIFYSLPDEEDIVTRASVVDQVVRDFDLKNKEKDFLKHCRQIIEMCLYDFTGRSRFEEMKFQPQLLLYPDVKSSDPYYESINIASLLGLVHPYDEKSGPFHPEASISRIHALKILLQATKMLQWKEKVELKKELGGIPGIHRQKTPFLDIDLKNNHMWWYPRYVNYAHLARIISDAHYFAPDEPLTQKVLSEWITNMHQFISSSSSVL
ncbi:MAG: FG-GAP-like repeat-containing protein [Patescibacteria group bacterium]